MAIKSRLFIILIVLTGFLYAVPVSADIEPQEMEFLKRYKIPLRWDNVEGSPVWLSGAEPWYDSGQQCHMVTLNPGDDVLVRLPARAMVRISNREKMPDKTALAAFISSGNGLFLKRPLIKGEENNSLLVQSDLQQTGLFRLLLSSSAKESVQIALFVSRYESSPEMLPYRHLLEIAAPTVDVQEKPYGAGQSFQRLSAGRPAQVRIKGPLRVLLEHRMVFPVEGKADHTPYTIKGLLDSRRFFTLSSSTRPENRVLLQVNGQYPTLGNLRKSYLSLPEGEHVLTLIPEHDLLVRLTARDDPDYLFQELNDPFPLDGTMSSGNSSGFVPFTELKESLKPLHPELLESVMTARSLWKKNRYPEGGLITAMAWSRLAEQFPGSAELYKESRRAKSKYTFYRDLFPQSEEHALHQSFTGIITPRLKKENRHLRVIQENSLPSIRDSVEKAYFSELPAAADSKQNSGAASLTYLLPKRETPTELRILVEVTSDSGSFAVTIGDNTEIQCDIIPQLIRPENEFELSTIEAVTNLPQNKLKPELDRLDHLTAVRNVAEVIIPLHTTADKIVLKPLAKNGHRLRVALQYRDSSPFAITEAEFLQAKTNLNGDFSPYQIALKMLADPLAELEGKSAGFGEGASEIESFLLPLIRYIHTRDIVYRSSVAPVADEPDRPVLPVIAVETLKKRIQQARDAGQWVAVLENSMVLHLGTRGQDKIDAAMLIVDALENSNEPYLAEMRLRGMLLYPKGDEGMQLAELSRIRLEKFYRDRDDLRSLSTLYAACLRRNPSPRIMGKLAGILLEEGRYRLALSASVILPSTIEQERESLLRSALVAGWQQLFADTVETISDIELQNYWQGLYQQKYSNLEDGHHFFYDAGTKGEEHLRAIEQARIIGEQLMADDLKIRQQAVLAWEQWQARLPGPYTWRNEPWLIHDHAGGVFLYSEAQDLKMAMFRANSNRPVRARIWGPARMKLILRPLHEKSVNETLNGWVFLRVDDKKMDLIPVSNNLPVQQWAMPPVDGTVPGRAIIYEYSFGPGPHEISLAGDTFPLLAGIQVYRPELNHGLPPLNHDGVAMILQGVKEKEEPCQVTQWRCLIDDCLAVLSRDPQETPAYFLSSQIKIARDSRHEYLEDQATGFINQLEKVRVRHPDSSKGIEGDFGKMAEFMAAGDWDRAVAAAREDTAAERFRLMSLLTYLAEIRPDRQKSYEAQARKRLQNHFQEREIHSLLQRISSHTQWQQIELIEGSGGLRLIPQQEWHPESPSLRVRKTLLTTQLDRDVVLGSRAPLVLSMNNIGVAELEVSWKLSEVSYLHPEHMDIAYQLDDQQQKIITLGPGCEETSVRLTIPAGRHRLVTTVKSRYSNQFLQVRFQEMSSVSETDGPRVVWSPPLKELAYHVVTRDEPLRASVQGPAWIRIDELRQSDTFSRYRYIKPGWQSVEILPDADRESALVRLFQRVERKNGDDEGLTRITSRTYPKLAKPVFVLSDRKDKKPGVDFSDAYPMGRQEDGTWSAALSWNERRNFDEDSVSEGSENFLQLSGSYYHFYEFLPAYLKTSFFVRKRTTGGPTIGLNGDISRRFNQFPLTLRLETEGLIQNPAAGETELFDRDPTEWSVRFKASAYQYRYFTPRLKHRPLFAIFGRVLSLDDASGYAPGTVDQDIFTIYKSDHKTGMQLSEYMGYRPWLDTALFVRGSYTTNSDMNPFNPDNIRLSAGAAQLLGPAQLDFRYQLTHYFDDEDRLGNIDRNDLSFGLSWDHWFEDQSRLQLGMKWQYRLNSGESTGMAGLTWFFSTGRAMRDLRPENDLFSAIKANRASQLMNNWMTDAEVSP